MESLRAPKPLLGKGMGAGQEAAEQIQAVTPEKVTQDPKPQFPHQQKETDSNRTYCKVMCKNPVNRVPMLVLGRLHAMLLCCYCDLWGTECARENRLRGGGGT